MNYRLNSSDTIYSLEVNGVSQPMVAKIDVSAYLVRHDTTNYSAPLFCKWACVWHTTHYANVFREMYEI